jgi:hypothetical protein
MGLNRTGILTSPIHAKEMIEGARELTVPPPGGPEVVSTYLLEEAKTADAIGSMPPPGTLKGVAKAVVEAMKGQRATVLLDKMGERLAFERTGSRLYEALLVKFDAHGSFEGGPSRAELESILDDELAHAGMLKDAMESLGADPTAMTPSANIAAVASMGVVQVLGDSRTNLKQCLEAILIAELVDESCWEVLTNLARSMGHEELGNEFHQAHLEEQEHLRQVRMWVTAEVGATASAELPTSPA